MSWILLTVLALLPDSSTAIRVKGASNELQETEDLSRRAYLQTLADDRLFWNATWDHAAQALSQLETAAEMSLGTFSGIQLSIAPANRSVATNKSVAANKTVAE